MAYPVVFEWLYCDCCSGPGAAEMSLFDNGSPKPDRPLGDFFTGTFTSNIHIFSAKSTIIGFEDQVE